MGQDYLVADGKNKYSVPFDLIGEKVVLRLTGQTVEVFYRGTRVAMHRRSCTAQRGPIVKMEHDAAGTPQVSELQYRGLYPVGRIR